MRRMYQTEWLGIPFEQLGAGRSTELAGAEFYRRFYARVFERFADWNALPKAWMSQKADTAAFLTGRLGPTGRVLSIGCGLGAIEHCLLERSPRLEVWIQDIAPGAWRWIAEEVPAERRLVGLLPECVPAGVTFDLVYLSAVDYALDDDALVHLLSAVRSVLVAGHGQCLILSGSFQPTPRTPREWASEAVRAVKRAGAAVLDRLHVRARGQFWGWYRTAAEYREIMRRSGYLRGEEGQVASQAGAYWIAGRSGQRP